MTALLRPASGFNNDSIPDWWHVVSLAPERKLDISRLNNDGYTNIEYSITDPH